MTVPTLIEPIPGGFRASTASELAADGPSAVAGDDQAMWDSFEAAMRENRLMSYVEQYGEDAVRDVIDASEAVAERYRAADDSAGESSPARRGEQVRHTPAS